MKTKLLRACFGILANALLAIGAVSIAAGPALALTVDQTRIQSPRFVTEQVVNTYRLTINFNDQGIAAAQQFGALPTSAYILSIDAYVTTAFNAGTTNVVTLGTTKASANEVVASGITAGTPGVYHLTSAAGLGLAVTNGVSPTLWAKYAQTGTAATTGAVTIVISFVPNNDM
jgi:hypothetical protein